MKADFCILYGVRKNLSTNIDQPSLKSNLSGLKANLNKYKYKAEMKSEMKEMKSDIKDMKFLRTIAIQKLPCRHITRAQRVTKI